MIATEVKYKKTGNEWVPEIPEHWEILKAKNIGYFEGSTVDKKIVKHDKLVRIVNFLDIYNNDTFEITEDVDFMKVSATEHQIKNLKVNVGDVVFTPSSEVREDIGKSAVVKYSADDLLFSYHVSRLKFTREIDINFKKYLFNNKPALKHFSKNCKGSTRKILNRIDFKNLPVYLPPIDEQIIIANFLDAQSNQITHFIQTKQRFIELLKEQRQSIITNAVTKGIDEKAKMKETRIEWIGRVPEHWEIRRLRYVGQCQNGINKGGEYFGTGFPFVGYTDVYKNEVIPSTLAGLAISSKADQLNYSVTQGDVFFTRTSETAEEIAISAVCLETIPKATFSGFLIRFRPLKGILHPGFSKYYFRCNAHRAYFVKEMLIVTRASLSQNLLNNLPILIPPIYEQKEIEAFINNETRNLDITISKAEREIELIKEYREAMIAEAVTGKMKL